MSLGPAALTASLPYALGRTPDEELVLVGVSGLSAAAAVILTLPLDAVDPADEEHAAEAVAAGLGDLVRSGADTVVVLVYADDTSTPSTAARFAATAVVGADALGLRVLDALAVSHGRWRSFDCDNPSCCPPDGTPIPTPEENRQ